MKVRPQSQPSADKGPQPCSPETPRPLGWPRRIYQRPWFAWRPVRLNGEGGDWVWLRPVMKTRLLFRAGDRLFEGNVYALLP